VVERVATDIAALGHDAGHFRRNNAFCINTGNYLALTYNDRSVLENMHAATCFQLMHQADRNILETLSKENSRLFRDQVVDLILATDMASHFEFIGQFRLTSNADNFDPEGQKHRELVTKCCVKAADLGHTALPWDLHEPWVLRLLTEFYEQGDEERSLGFPVSPMCSHIDASNLNEFKESQKGFLHFVVTPLYKELSVVLVDHDIAGICLQRIELNGKQWIDGELSPELVAVVTGVPQGDVTPQMAAAKLPNSDVHTGTGSQSPSTRLLPPGRTRQEMPVFKAGDQVWIMKEGRMKGKLADVLDPCWNGLVKVSLQDPKGEIKSYHPVLLELAVSVFATPGEAKDV
jgi:hypothetical protein